MSSEIEIKLSIFDEATRRTIRADLEKIAEKERYYQNGSDVLMMGAPADLARHQAREFEPARMLSDALVANGERGVTDVELSVEAGRSAFEMFEELAKKRLETDEDFMEIEGKEGFEKLKLKYPMNK